MDTSDQGQGTQKPTIEERIAKVTEPTKETSEPMPSSQKEETSKEGTETEVAEASKNPNVVADAKASKEDLDLPEGVTQRTKEQFEKLKERLRLAEEKAKATTPEPPPPSSNSVFDSFRTPMPGQPAPEVPFLSPQQIGALQQQYIDEQGNVDIAGLNKALLESNEVARQALTRAKEAEDKFTRFEENQQVKEAHTEHPDLDPQSPSFDPTLFDMVKDRLLRNMYEGKKQTLLEVTNEIKKVYTGRTQDVAKVKEQAVEEFKATQQARDQEPLENGVGAPREDVGKLEELRKQTRQGKAEALDERLRKLGILKT